MLIVTENHKEGEDRTSMDRTSMDRTYMAADSVTCKLIQV